MIDAFFLGGQREGCFRLDVPTSDFAEFLFRTITGLAESQRRGAWPGRPFLIRPKSF